MQKILLDLQKLRKICKRCSSLPMLGLKKNGDSINDNIPIIDFKCFSFVLRINSLITLILISIMVFIFYHLGDKYIIDI